MRKISLLFIIILILSSALLTAQDKVKVNAQIRPRFQYDDKDFNRNTGANSFTELRSRLGVLYSPSEYLSGFVQIQDSRRFGVESSTLSSMANLDLHQAYFKINNFFKLPLNLKVGRMELSYGSQRLIGAVAWHNVGRSFDGSVLKLVTKSIDIDFIAARTNETGFAGDSLDSFLYSAYGDLVLADKLNIQPFVIAEYQAKADFNRYTIGVYMGCNDKKKAFQHELDAAYQLGAQNATQDISAFMVAYNLGYTFNTIIKPMIGVGIAYLSGDDGSDSEKYKVFNTLYATNHKFYGYMDYFLNIPNNTYGLGLMDIHVKTSIVPAEKFKIALALHMFTANADYTLLDGNTSTNFGSEMDLTLAYVYNKYVNFVGGFSLFSAGDIFKETRGEDLSTWTYIMAIVNL